MVDSGALELAALNETVGGKSSSAMMAVTCWMPDSVPLVTLETSTTMVSSASSRASWTAVKVIKPVGLPAGIVIEVPERV